MIGRTNAGGGSGGGVPPLPRIRCIGTDGDTVSATKGATTVNGKFKNGVCYLKVSVDEDNAWSVTCGDVTRTIVVSETKEYVANFAAEYLFIDGDECTDITGGWDMYASLSQIGDLKVTVENADGKLHYVRDRLYSDQSSMLTKAFTLIPNDLQFTKVCFHFTSYRGFNNSADGNFYKFGIVDPTKSDYVKNDFLVEAFLPATDGVNYEVKLDISSLTIGAQYKVGLCGYHQQGGTVGDREFFVDMIWLE